ncbi:MAG: sigma factor [Candidatus Anstonellales archaeon]
MIYKKHLQFINKKISPKSFSNLGPHLKNYLNSISNLPDLTIEQEMELIRRYRENNDLNAYELLIKSNSKLVFYIVFRIDSEYTDDLVQSGLLGLMKAIEKYTPKGYRLSSYASFWIYKEIDNTLKLLNSGSGFLRIDDLMEDNFGDDLTFADLVGSEDSTMSNFEFKTSSNLLFKKIEDEFGNESLRILEDYYDSKKKKEFKDYKLAKYIERNVRNNIKLREEFKKIINK